MQSLEQPPATHTVLAICLQVHSLSTSRQTGDVLYVCVCAMFHLIAVVFFNKTVMNGHLTLAIKVFPSLLINKRVNSSVLLSVGNF